MSTIVCPYCNQTYKIDSNIIGQKVRCAVCNEPFIALEPETPVPQETTPVITETPASSQKLYSQTYVQNSYGTQPKTVHVHQNVYIQQPQQSPQQAYIPPATESDKSRDTFALLAFFLGSFGVHEFYIGNIGNGIALILANFLCSPPAVIFIVGIDLLRTTTDSQKLPLKNRDSSLAQILGILMIIGGILLFIPFCFAMINS
jgi:predicted Zn finger-like uncharacterized protein